MKKSHVIILFSLFVLLFLSIYYENYTDRYWGLISLLFLSLFLLDFIFIFDEKIGGSKDAAMLAILGAISAASRIPFAGIPSIQPSTFIVMVVGYTLGAYAGFIVGMETALLSNFFLGQGPWTPWQMLAWGLAGLLGASLKFMHGRRGAIYVLMLAGFLYGYIYGVITNIWYWLAFIYPHTWQSFLAVWFLSIYFDTMHAIGNVLFFDLFGLKMIKILSRYRTKLSVFSPQMSRGKMQVIQK